MSERLINVDEATLRAVLFRITREGVREFDVYLESGSWPKSLRLIAAVDGADPDYPEYWRFNMWESHTTRGETSKHKVVKIYP
jgi:hypothetical protein